MRWGCDVSHRARISQRGGEKFFSLTSFFIGRGRAGCKSPHPHLPRGGEMLFFLTSSFIGLPSSSLLVLDSSRFPVPWLRTCTGKTCASTGRTIYSDDEPRHVLMGSRNILPRCSSLSLDYTCMRVQRREASMHYEKAPRIRWRWAPPPLQLRCARASLRYGGAGE